MPFTFDPMLLTQLIDSLGHTYAAFALSQRRIVVGMNVDVVMVHVITASFSVTSMPQFECYFNLFSVLLLCLAWFHYPLVWKPARGPVWTHWYFLLPLSMVVGIIAGAEFPGILSKIIFAMTFLDSISGFPIFYAVAHHPNDQLQGHAAPTPALLYCSAFARCSVLFLIGIPRIDFQLPLLVTLSDFNGALVSLCTLLCWISPLVKEQLTPMECHQFV